jgi:hypothetical protein
VQAPLPPLPLLHELLGLLLIRSSTPSLRPFGFVDELARAWPR